MKLTKTTTTMLNASCSWNGITTPLYERTKTILAIIGSNISESSNKSITERCSLPTTYLLSYKSKDRYVSLRKSQTNSTLTASMTINKSSLYACT